MSKLRIILPSFLLLLFTLTFSYVYAAFSNDFTVNGVASVEKATVMITVVDSKFTPEIEVTAEERETALTGMIEIALKAVTNE